MNKQIKAGADIHAGDGGYNEGTQEQYDAFVKVRNKSLAQGRIRQLAEQARQYYLTLPTGFNPENVGMYPQLMEKFAELIVAECAAIINDIPSSPQGSWSDGYYEGCTDSAKQIKQHFGVEL